MTKQKKSTTIDLRVSYEQKEAIREAASKLGMGISKYLLYLATHKNVMVIDGGRELAKELYHLNSQLNRLESNQKLDVQNVRDAVSKEIKKLIM